MSVISRVGRKSLALTLTSAMTAVFALVGVSTANADVASATIRLLSDDKAPKAMTEKTYWSAPRSCTLTTSCDYVKMITAGSDLVLHYNVKDASNNALASTLVTLNVSVPEGATAGTFTGSLTGTTNSSGDVTFTLRNTNTSANSELFPIGASNLGYWDDSRGALIGKATQYNIAPTVGAATEVVDSVMTHVVQTPLAAANIRLTAGDTATMTNKTYWDPSGDPQGCLDLKATCNYAKFVVAGDDLNLHYVVTDAAGAPLANTPIALNLGQPDGAIATAYSGDMYKITDANGAVTFALHNTATNSLAEPRPAGQSTMIYWDDTRIVDQAYALNFSPSVGAVSEVVDNVWSHTVKSPSVSGTANIYLTSADRAGMDDKSYWWRSDDLSNSFLKFVPVGKDLVLNYVVTDGSGNPIASTPVTLATTSKGAGATFTGALTKNTDANGAVTFTLKNTNAPSAAEDYPYAPSSVTHWDDTRAASLSGSQYEMDFVPTVGAGTEHTDRVWSHIFKPGAPTAPQGVNIKATSTTSAVVSWSAPADDGNSAVTGYTYTVKNNGAPVSGATGTIVGTSATVTGLVASGKYSVSVTANNAVGSSSAASSLGTVTPVAVTAVKAPGAVTKSAAVAGNTFATLTWTAPTANNNASLINYSVAVKSGATLVKTVVLPVSTTVLTPSKLSVTGAVISGLTNGTAYTFVISATNAIGSTTAAATAAVTPFTVPDAPTNVNTSNRAASLNVTWTVPASNGGSPLTGYIITYTSTAGVTKTSTAAASATSLLVKSLVNGTTYTVKVQAKTAKGNSAMSLSTTGTPSTVPVALKTVTGVAGTGQVTVNWTAAANTATVPANGGSAITGYDIVAKQGTTVVASEHTNQFGSSKIITGLTKGVAYTFTVTAVNANGSSAAKVSAAVKPL